MYTNIACIKVTSIISKSGGQKGSNKYPFSLLKECTKIYSSKLIKPYMYCISNDLYFKVKCGYSA